MLGCSLANSMDTPAGAADPAEFLSWFRIRFSSPA